MAFKILETFFGRKSSDGFKIDQPSMNDQFVNTYDNMVNQTRQTEQETTKNDVLLQSEVVENWRKSSLSSKYEILIMEMDAILTEQKIIVTEQTTQTDAQKSNKDRQQYIKLKERELELINEIYYIETTILRMELTRLRAIKN